MTRINRQLEARCRHQLVDVVENATDESMVLLIFSELSFQFFFWNVPAFLLPRSSSVNDRLSSLTANYTGERTRENERKKRNRRRIEQKQQNQTGEISFLQSCNIVRQLFAKPQAPTSCPHELCNDMIIIISVPSILFTFLSVPCPPVRPSARRPVSPRGGQAARRPGAQSALLLPAVIVIASKLKLILLIHIGNGFLFLHIHDERSFLFHCLG